jgi:hypothetical protein
VTPPAGWRRRPLFTDEPIDRYFENQRARLEKEVADFSEETLLGGDGREIVDYLVDKYSVECPVLRVEDGELDRQMAPLGAVSMVTPVHQVRLEAPRYEIAVPFDGDADVFGLTPNPVSSSAMPEVDVQPGRILITWHQPENTAGPEQIKAWIDQQVDLVNGFLRQSQANIDAFNARLADIAANTVSARRARWQASRDVAGALGFRLRRRPDAGEYEIPIRRRVLRSLPKPTSSPSTGPKYSMGNEDYEAALAVLEHQRNALERSPSLTAKLGEEQIRLLLLVGLNAVFEGDALGEVFNAAGKTDILIRVNDANVFVAECKIWDGAKVVTAAISQLLSYLTWRDTKGALLLFIRRVNVTDAIAKAVEAIEAHPCHVRTLPTADGTTRLDFILHAVGDESRLLRLAFLPFALGRDEAAKL